MACSSTRRGELMKKTKFKLGMQLHSHDNGKTWFQGPCRRKSKRLSHVTVTKVDRKRGIIEVG